MNDREHTATLLMATRGFEPLELLSPDSPGWGHRADDDDAAAAVVTATAAATAGGIIHDTGAPAVDLQRMDLLSSVDLIRVGRTAVAHG